MPPDRAEPGEERSQGVSGPNVSYYDDLVMRVGKTIQRTAAPASPQSSRTQFPVPEKRGCETQTVDETPATDSEKSEPRGSRNPD
jgi:hypothetical protein